jgi:ACR3 family arsenite efflux pump ArsB
MFFLAGILVGLLLNYLFGGFDFSTLLCFFAGLFLIMPLLVKFSFNDLKYVLHHKKALFWNIVLNFILFPLLAFIIGYFIFGTNHYLTVSLVLLALIPG